MSLITKKTSKRIRADQKMTLQNTVDKFASRPIDGIELSYSTNSDGEINSIDFMFSITLLNEYEVEYEYTNKAYSVELYKPSNGYSWRQRTSTDEKEWKYRIKKDYEKQHDLRSTQSVYNKIVERYQDWCEGRKDSISRKKLELENHKKLQQDLGAKIYKTKEYRSGYGRRNRGYYVDNNWLVVDQNHDKNGHLNSAALRISESTKGLVSIEKITGLFTKEQVIQLVDFLRNLGVTLDSCDYELEKLLNKESEKFKTW